MNQTTATIRFYSSNDSRIREMIPASLEYHEDQSGLSISVPAGQSIQEALENAAINLPQPAVALVNGRTEDLAYGLKPGDEIMILFQISGG